MNAGHTARERRQFEIERDFVQMPHRAALPAPRHNRSSIELPAFHGISFRVVRGKSGRFQLLSGYHQLDGSWERASSCACGTHWDPDFRVERFPACPIDEHKIEAQRAFAAD